MSTDNQPPAQNEAAAPAKEPVPNEPVPAKEFTDHEVYAGHIVIPGLEIPEHFAELFKNYKDEWNPQTQTAFFCVTQLAQAHWRLGRMTRIETALFAKHGPILHQFFEQDCQSNGILAKLERYANSARHQYERALRNLIALRREQRAHDRHPGSEIRHAPEFSPIEAVKTNPIPLCFANELKKLKKFHPDFDPARNRSPMSDALRDYVKDPRNLIAARELVDLIGRPTDVTNH